jgi:uncharacterized membrane protein
MMKNLSFTRAALLAALSLAPSCVSTWMQDEADSETAPRDYSALEEVQMPGPSEKVSFTRHVKPILETKCLPCHSGTDTATAYKLNDRESAFSTGLPGARIVPGHPGRSLLLDVAGTHRNVAAMPAAGNRLTEAESRLLARWIKEGASWPAGPAGHLRAP